MTSSYGRVDGCVQLGVTMVRDVILACPARGRFKTVRHVVVDDPAAGDRAVDSHLGPVFR